MPRTPKQRKAKQFIQTESERRAPKAAPANLHLQLQRAIANPAAASSSDLLTLQRLVGNQAVVNLLSRPTTGEAAPAIQAKLQVGPAGDGYEQEADRVAHQVTHMTAPAGQMSRGAGELLQRQAGSPLAVSPGVPRQIEQTLTNHQQEGAPLPEAVRDYMEPRFGADFGQVRVHTDDEAATLSQTIQAQAFTHGSNIYFDSGEYRPETEQGKQLLAHELTHVIQQNGAGQASGQTEVQVQGRLPKNRLSRKQKLMHLDFIKMKRKNAQIPKMLLSGLIKGTEPRDAYGHWWTEVGDLSNNTWVPLKSYGWWPSHGVSIAETLKGVPGQLNKGQGEKDPHQGKAADTQFHPVMEVDDQEDYAAVRQRVTSEVENFAQGFTGSWNWRFGWGKNCHTFQQRLKKAVGLHNKKSKYWLLDPRSQQQQEQDRLDAEAEALSVSQWLILRGFLPYYTRTEGGGFTASSEMIRNETRIGVTGQQEGGKVQFAVEGALRWTTPGDFENATGVPYPGLNENNEAGGGQTTEPTNTETTPPVTEEGDSTPDTQVETVVSNAPQLENGSIHTLKTELTILRGGGLDPHPIPAGIQILIRKVEGEKVYVDGADSSVGFASLNTVLAAIGLT